MGADGWLGVGWPKEYGGQGRTAVEQFDLLRRGAARRRAVPFVTLNTVGPTLMRFGTEEQKAYFLPGILPARCTSRSATPSPRRAPTSRRCAPARCATATSTSSTARRSSPAAADHADCVWLAVPHRPRRAASTRASRSCSCRHDAPGLHAARRSTRSAAASPTPPTTTDVRVPASSWSARRTAAGS